MNLKGSLPGYCLISKGMHCPNIQMESVNESKDGHPSTSEVKMNEEADHSSRYPEESGTAKHPSAEAIVKHLILKVSNSIGGAGGLKSCDGKFSRDSSILSSKSSLLENICSASPIGHLSNSSSWSVSEPSTTLSWVESPQVDLECSSELLAMESMSDLYKVRGKLGWADIGNYSLATEVSWMSVDKMQLEYAAGALQRFRLLIEQLAEVNPVHLDGNEKLAFWINLYNALIMHAAYTVGGHSFSAACIEYVILKTRPPVHRPQTALLLALHKLKVSDEQRKFSIETSEPLVAFALSCGTYSSPAVKIYSPRNVREQLQEAQRDFIRASVGVSNKGKLLVPKMLHCFARGFVDDANIAVWISHFLPQQQAAFVEQCISRRRQSFLGSRNCGIIPFDSRFRYLFLPEKLP
ncbi:hypothetical protein COCNU_02G019970 [Cocos nucifera]|uniref:DUF547 domain-containing protein n=1 Tax=Cocos nucifera TaxID=13894 RepID=A0A8K0MYE1_COCNU|nr:hypothetical protein COCNU_02G019970 [Cocos nucifera]